MHISLVVAMAENRVIGLNNQMPWHLPEDLKYFRRLTMGKPILMGRKTYETLGRPLPGRLNVVVTRQPDFHPEGCQVYGSIDDALEALADYPEVMVIGGATIYQQFLGRADTLYLTLIGAAFEGDTCFPEFDRDEWVECQREDIPDDGVRGFGYSFLTFRRHRPTA